MIRTKAVTKSAQALEDNPRPVLYMFRLVANLVPNKIDSDINVLVVS